jgi:hypothetical protein
MSDRLPWFRCFPSALLGALAGLDADEGIIYVTALLRIYETGGPVAETPRTLSRRTGLTERKAGAALGRLIEAGKLTTATAGKLDSASTHAEIAWQHERHRDQSAAGKASAARRQEQVSAEKNSSSEKTDASNKGQKTQRNQRISATAVERPSNHKEEDTDQKKDKPSSEGARAAPTPRKCKIDPDWTLGVDEIRAAEQSGISAVRARQIWPAFIDHHVHHGTLGLDWLRGWRTWCRKDVEFASRGHRNRPPDQGAGSFHVALDRLSRNLGMSDEPARTPSRFEDLGSVIDHEGDGPDDRDLLEPSGRHAGQPGAASHLRVVGADWR